MDLSEIYNVKPEDWTCPNCGHQSPIRTFEILEKADERLKTAIEALDKIKDDENKCIASHSGEFRNGSHTAFAQQAELAREALEKIK